MREMMRATPTEPCFDSQETIPASEQVVRALFSDTAHEKESVGRGMGAGAH